jgi:hypothetical protein
MDPSIVKILEKGLQQPSRLVYQTKASLRSINNIMSYIVKGPEKPEKRFDILSFPQPSKNR